MSRELFHATTSAVSTKQPVWSSGSGLLLTADALATTETCPVYVKAGDTWVALSDLGGNAIKLTATVPSITLAGGGVEYAVTKDATASACAVYATDLA